MATLLSPTATNKYRRQVRSAAGGTTTSTASTANSAIRAGSACSASGNELHAFHSSNGTSWTAIGSPRHRDHGQHRCFVGLAVTSHADGILATGTFDNVTITGASPGARRRAPLALYLEAENGTLTSPLQTLSPTAPPPTAGPGR